jgi:hypothetical protein
MAHLSDCPHFSGITFMYSGIFGGFTYTATREALCLFLSKKTQAIALSATKDEVSRKKDFLFARLRLRVVCNQINGHYFKLRIK